MVNMGRIKERMQEMLKEYTIDYTRQYKLALINDRRQAKMGGPPKIDEPDWRLKVNADKLIKNVQIEGVVLVGDGFKQKRYWSMNRNFVVTDTPDASDASSSSSPKASSTSEAKEDEEEVPADTRIWLDDSCADQCMNPTCDVKFGLFSRRSHCRHCGEIFCGKCNGFKIGSDKFCEPCHKLRSVAGSAESKLPILTKPKEKILMRDFYSYECRTYPTGDHKKPAGADGKYLIYLSHRRQTKPQPVIAFETDQERQGWYSYLSMACRQAPMFITNDQVLRPTFKQSFNTFRWRHWVWSNDFDGTESELLTDVIYTVCEREVFGTELRALGDLPRKMMKKSIEGVIEGGVAAAWSAIQKSLASIRPEIEKAADGMIAPILDAELSIKEKVKGPVEEATNAALDTVGQQMQDEFASKLPALGEAAEAQLKMIYDCLVKLNTDTKDKPQEFMREFNSLTYRTYWSNWYEQKPIADILENAFCGDNAKGPSRSLAYDLRYDLRDIQQSAWVVIKKHLQETASQGGSEYERIKPIFGDIIERAAHDINLAFEWRFLKALDSEIRYPIVQKTNEVIVRVGRPLAAAIPAAIKDVVDPERTCKEIVNETIHSTEVKLVSQALASVTKSTVTSGAKYASLP